MNEKYLVSISAKVPARVKRAIRKKANHEGKTLSAYIANMIWQSYVSIKLDRK